MSSEYRLLNQSLCILSGISAETEIVLKRQGIVTCYQLTERATELFSPRKAHQIRSSYREFQQALRLNLTDWLINHLPIGHRVRVLCDMPDDALYYDIETDGRGAASMVTCIATAQKNRTAFYCAGINLEGFLSDWARAKILVSFNGKRFDTPIICKRFGLTTIPAQIDLMDELRHFGYQGGLKSIEKALGFKRAQSTCVNGNDAVQYWQLFQQTGDPATLEQLRIYNQEDVASLQFLARRLLKLSLENNSII